jgi:conjugative relaxase-like TrwC/TraI family protein
VVKGGFHFYRGDGKGATAYFEEGHRRAEGYYSEHGRSEVLVSAWEDGRKVGADRAVAGAALEAWVEGLDPETRQPKGKVRAPGPGREPLRFVEATVNNPKSLSVVASQDQAIAKALEALLERQAEAVSGYFSKVAVTRVGPRGAQEELGGLRVEVARVHHYSARGGDPHHHVHLMLNMRAQAKDGTWHGLHSAALRSHIRAVNNVGHRVLMTDAAFAQALAAEGYSLGGDGEIEQARGAVKLLSKRSAQVASARTGLEAAWRQAHPGREPSQRLRNGWDHEAWAKARPGKKMEAPELATERWRQELARAGFDFTPGAHRRERSREMGLPPPPLGKASTSPEALAEEAVASLSAQKSAWGAPDLSAAVEAALSRSGLSGGPDELQSLADAARQQAEARCTDLLGGEQALSTSRHLTSAAVLEADLALAAGLARLAGAGGERDRAGASAAREAGLSTGQAEALSAIAGTRRLEVVVGPAGAGKTTVLGAARERLFGQGRDLHVVAPTKKAALVAGAEVGAEATSLSKLLYDHGWRWDALGRHQRLSPGDVDPATGQAYMGVPAEARLGPSSVLVVDEASLVTVDQAIALTEVVAETGASLRLLGDPRQLGAIGRGGVMEEAAAWAGGAVYLDRVQRFLALEPAPDGLGEEIVLDRAWAGLSLALRRRDRPEEAVDALFERGAVVVHRSEESAIAALAIEAAEAATRPGSLALSVATNEAARALNEATRGLLVSRGTVDDDLVATAMGEVRIGVGDRVVTRRNDPTLGVANRQAWQVAAVGPDGSVALDGGGRWARLPASYVAEALDLAYASTGYGNQGVTAERSATWVGPATTAAGLYVGATRGRWQNTLHVVARGREHARAELVAALGRERSDRGLAEARDRAEVGQVFVSTSTSPRRWRSAAELDRAEARARAELSMAARPAFASAEEARALDRADREAAAEARAAAETHRQAAEAERSRLPAMERAALTDMAAAREDAKVVEARPGAFGRRAAKVEAARAHLEELRERWGPRQLPGPAWPDGAVTALAGELARAVVARAASSHMEGARAALEEAARHEQAVANRRAWAGIEAAHEARQRPLVEAAKRALEEVARARAERARLTEPMSPGAVRAADRARDAYLLRERHRALFERPLGRSPGRGQEGPGLDL